MRTGFRIRVAMVALGAIGLVVPAPVVADGEIPTTTTITEIAPASPQAFNPITMTVNVVQDAPSGGTTGQVDFYDVAVDPPAFLGSSGGFTGGVWQSVSLPDGLAAGPHSIEARFTPSNAGYASSTSAPVVLTVTKIDPLMHIGGPDGSVEANHTFDLWAVAQVNNHWSGATGTLSVWRVGALSPTCTYTGFPLDVGCTAGPLPVGTYQFVAKFSGNDQVLADQSDPITVTVVADTVQATAIGVDLTTFYPYRDSYKDTVAIKGARAEPISVTIKIYSPGGSLLKTVSIASGTGAYAYAWNGRNSAGTWYAAGKYKTVQTLKDAAGTTKVVIAYVTLSKKRIYTYTKTITKLGSSMTAKGATSGASVTWNTSSGWAKLYVSTYWTNWAGAGWELTLPSATLYKSFYVRVYGRSTGMGTTSVGAQNFSTCGYVSGSAWDVSCFGASKELSPTSGTTLYYYRTANLPTAYRYGAKVRISVSSYGGLTYIYKAQVVVTYGVLK